MEIIQITIKRIKHKHFFTLATYVQRIHIWIQIHNRSRATLNQCKGSSLPSFNSCQNQIPRERLQQTFTKPIHSNFILAKVYKNVIYNMICSNGLSTTQWKRSSRVAFYLHCVHRSLGVPPPPLPHHLLSGWGHG